MIDNIITEIGFIQIGGAAAAIPIALMGLILNKEKV